MVLKTLATFANIPLVGNEPIAWSFITGPMPFETILTVHEKNWPQIERILGTPQTLIISDSTRKIGVHQLYAIHEHASASPYQRTFSVVDRRYWWQYETISRDYNIAKAVGNRIFLKDAPKIETPSQGAISGDQYDYRQYSLKNGKDRWTPQEAVTDVLEQLHAADDPRRDKRWRIESFPIKNDGQFSMQNVMLHDPGDVALGRLLGFIPGCEIYIDAEGHAVVFDGADMDASDEHYDKKIWTNGTTWEGNVPRVIDRKHIRPKEVHVMYQREVECVFKYKDDYASKTQTGLSPNGAWVENVIPTTDPVTTIDWWDPIGKYFKSVKVPAGTWLPARDWLDEMDRIKGKDSWPWTFDLAREHWQKGGLDIVWGAHPHVDVSELGSVQARIDSFKAHFRQTFRINRRFMERINNISATRSAIINPMTGDQGPAQAWGEICIIPSYKGMTMAQRFDPDRTGAYCNLQTLPPASSRPLSSTNQEDVTDNTALPLQIAMLDPDRGIFQISHDHAPYGTEASWVPCHLEFGSAPNKPTSHGRDLTKQKNQPMMPGVVMQGSSNGEFLRKKMEMWFMLTIVPGAPNNKRRYDTFVIEPKDVEERYRTNYRITDGVGPVMEVFITPGEMMARYGWKIDDECFKTIERLLGLNSEDPNKAGLVDDPKTKKVDESQMLGFMLTNDGNVQHSKDRHLRGHAIAVAAEIYASYADGLEGQAVTRLPRHKNAGQPWLVGNMDSATIQVDGYPEAAVNVTHSFPGKQDPISRMALLFEPVRQLVLGIIPFRKAGIS